MPAFDSFDFPLCVSNKHLENDRRTIFTSIAFLKNAFGSRMAIVEKLNYFWIVFAAQIVDIPAAFEILNKINFP